MDLKIASAEGWYNVNDITGITAGTQFKIQNKSSYFYILKESSTQPLATSFEGEYITTLRDSEPSKVITSGSDIIWIRNTTNDVRTIFINAQEA